MKKILLILLSVLFYNFASAQTTAVQQWVQFYNGPDSLNDGSFSLDVHGNIYVSGASQVPPITNPMTYKITTIKYDSNGGLKWVAIYDSISNASYKSIAMKVDASSNVYVAGSVISNQFIQTTDIVLLKYDSTGTLLWSSLYAYPYGKSDEPKAIALDLSGNVYITGFVSDSSSVAYSGISKEFVTLKFNSSGVQQWVRYYSDNNKLDDISNDVVVDNSGNVYITGYSYNYPTTRDIVTIKYNTNGIQQWIKKYDGGGDDYTNKLALDNSNNVYITGTSKHNSSEDYITIKYDNSGTQLWMAFYNGTGNGFDVAKDIAVDNNGQIIITGTSLGNGTYSDYVTVKYDSNGNQLWTANYNGTGNNADEANALSLDVSGNIYITGQSAGLTTDNDYATVKYNASGIQQWTIRLDGVADSIDVATDIKADSYGNVYVTGYSHNGTDYDFATVKYSEITTIPLSVSITKNDATCNGAANGTAGVMASGGTIPYTYQWSTGQTTQNITGLAAGTYIVTVTDSTAATITANIIINEPPIDTLINPAPCSELFISEYISGTTHNTALEFYNPSENPIVLNRYFVRVFMNGAPTPLITQLTGILAPKHTYVLANPNASSAILTKTDQTSHKINFNGDDAIQLIKVLNNININIDSIEGHGGNPHDIFDTLHLKILDQIGIPNVTPGNGGWTVGNNGSTKNSTLIRNFGVSSGQTDWDCGRYQWKVLPQDNISNLRIHQNVCAALLNADITYSFANPIETGTSPRYFEFDIMVQGNNNSTYLDNAAFFIQYNTSTFGQNIVANNKITITKGANFNSITYVDPNTVVQDDASDVFNFYFGSDYNAGTWNRTNINTSLQQLVHIKIEVANCYQNTLLQFINQSQTSNVSWYADNPTEDFLGTFFIYDNTYYQNSLNEVLCQVKIDDFTSPINAGVGDILTITGSNFGNIRGTGQVKFVNSDECCLSYVQKLNNIDYISWSNTQIKIRVPFKVDSLYNILGQPLKAGIGGGNFIVKNAIGDSAISSNNLAGNPFKVYYAIQNTSFTSNGYQKYKVNLSNDNNDGGYTFRLDTSFNSNPAARGCVQKAIKEWMCYTGANITLGLDTSLTYVSGAVDGVNYIFFTSTLNANIPASSSQTFSLCPTSNNSYQKEFDILINNTTNWQFDTTGASIQSGKIDFYGVMLHEIGHIILLGHVNDLNDVMFWLCSTGPLTPSQRVSLQPYISPVEGGTYSVSSSGSVIYAGLCNVSVMVPSNTSLCGNYGVHELFDGVMNLNIFPNPANDEFINVAYELKEHSSLKFIISDITGRLISETEPDNCNIGKHQEQINVDHLPSGIYFLIININGKQQTNKFIKL